MPRTLRIELDEFGWRRLSAEARDQGTTPDELARHAILYFLADVDSGRLARRLPTMRFGKRDSRSKRRTSDAE